MWKLVKLKRNGIGLSHLLFANDIIFFSKAIVDQARLIDQILQGFSNVSGLKINVHKSGALA